MNPKYVVSLGISKALKKFGFPQKTDFYWYEVDGLPQILEKGEWQTVAFGAEYNLLCAAPHVGELGEWLPWQIILNKRDEVYLGMSKEEDEHRLWYEGLDETGTEFVWESIFGETEANARALMLIWLYTNKRIKPKLL